MSKKKLNSLQVRIEKDYNNRIVDFCKRNGISKAECIRYMVDTLQLKEQSDVELERWQEYR